MKVSRATVLLAVLLAPVGCGSRLVGSEAGGETTGDPSTTEPGTTGDPEPSTTIDPDPDTTSDPDPTTFVPDVDVIVEQQCDIFEQDCPEDEKCVPYSLDGGSWNANKCVPIMGAQATGEPCWSTGPEQATDDCDASGMCWNVDGEGAGTCHAFCEGSADDPACPDGSYCLVPSDGAIALCFMACDPIAQDCVDEGTACYWANQYFNCMLTTENIPPGEPCGYLNDCSEGNMCIDATYLPDCMGAACCSSYCDLQLGDAPCQAALPGTTCVPFFEEPVPGYENVGICIVP